jgi:hypothetical protein
MGWRRLFLLLCPAALLLAVPGFAQQEAAPPAKPSPEKRKGPSRAMAPARVWASPDGKVLYLVGKIERGTFRKFSDVARANPKAETLFLASLGGIMIDGYLIGNTVRTRKLDTWVEHVCASSCAQIFTSGKARLIGRHARLGFHQSYIEDEVTGDAVGTDYSRDGALAETIGKGGQFNPTDAGDNLVVRGLRRAGATEVFIAKVLRTPPEELWYPETAELVLEGLVTRVVDAEPRLQLPKSALSRESLDAELLVGPLWRALHTHEQAMFEELALGVWREANIGYDLKEILHGARNKTMEKLTPRIPLAPDPVLDRFVVALARQAELQRKFGYPACSAKDVTPGSPAEAEFLAQGAQFEEPMAALLGATEQVPKPTAAQAQKTFRKNTRRILATGIYFGDDGSTGTERDCRYAFRTEEAIDRLEPKYRLPVMRAWLSM